VWILDSKLFLLIICKWNCKFGTPLVKNVLELLQMRIIREQMVLLWYLTKLLVKVLKILMNIGWMKLKG